MKKSEIYGMVALAFGVLLVGWLFLRIMVHVSHNSQQVKPNDKVYQVMKHDEEGYYYAVRVTKAEDNTYVPLSYYNKKDECIVYMEHNVQTTMPHVGDLVRIHISNSDEQPYVFLARR